MKFMNIISYNYFNFFILNYFIISNNSQAIEGLYRLKISFKFYVLTEINKIKIKIKNI